MEAALHVLPVSATETTTVLTRTQAEGTERHQQENTAEALEGQKGLKTPSTREQVCSVCVCVCRGWVGGLFSWTIILMIFLSNEAEK